MGSTGRRHDHLVPAHDGRAERIPRELDRPPRRSHAHDGQLHEARRFGRAGADAPRGDLPGLYPEAVPAVGTEAGTATSYANTDVDTHSLRRRRTTPCSERGASAVRGLWRLRCGRPRLRQHDHTVEPSERLEFLPGTRRQDGNSLRSKDVLPARGVVASLRSRA